MKNIKTNKQGYRIGLFDRSKNIEPIAARIYEHMFPDRHLWEDETDNWLKDQYRDCAKKLSSWIQTGKIPKT